MSASRDAMKASCFGTILTRDRHVPAQKLHGLGLYHNDGGPCGGRIGCCMLPLAYSAGVARTSKENNTPRDDAGSATG